VNNTLREILEELKIFRMFDRILGFVEGFESGN
jgi:hypothetical protein